MRFRNVRRYAVGGHRASVQKAVFPFGKIPGMRFRDRIPPAAFRANRSAETDRKTEIFRRPGSETRHESGRGLSSGDRTNESRRPKNNLFLPVFGNIFHIFVFDASVRHGIDDPMRRRVRFGACRQQKFACETALPNGPGQGGTKRLPLLHRKGGTGRQVFAEQGRKHFRHNRLTI